MGADCTGTDGGAAAGAVTGEGGCSGIGGGAEAGIGTGEGVLAGGCEGIGGGVGDGDFAGLAPLLPASTVEFGFAVCIVGTGGGAAGCCTRCET
jgi:hypothetical protein